MGASAKTPSLRALDARALYNPGFVGALIGSAAKGHHQDFNSPLPAALAFLVAPMVLHRSTRESLPRVNGRLASWAERNPLIRAELQRRAPRLTPVTRQALRFGLGTELLVVEGAGFGPGRALMDLDPNGTEDIESSFTSAERLGRWLSRAGPPSTVYGLLGLQP
jgi:Family of unknown function (DUF6521)